MVAYIPPDTKRCAYDYSLDGDESLFFGYVDKLDTTRGSLHLCKLLWYKKLETFSNVGWEIDRFSVKEKRWSMRLATAEEASKIKAEIVIDQLGFWGYPTSFAPYFFDKHLTYLSNRPNSDKTG